MITAVTGLVGAALGAIPGLRLRRKIQQHKAVRPIEPPNLSTINSGSAFRPFVLAMIVLGCFGVIASLFYLRGKPAYTPTPDLSRFPPLTGPVYGARNEMDLPGPSVGDETDRPRRVYVHGYFRKDGKWVAPYYRSYPGR